MIGDTSAGWLAPPQKRGRRWKRHLDRLARAWSLPGGRRQARLLRMLAAASRLDEQPSRRAEIAYLLGCHYVDAGDFSRAARMFECCYHDDDALVTASVLVFACLKRQLSPDGGFLNHVLESWRELKRPRLLRWARERQLLRLGGPPASQAARGRDPVLDALRHVPIRRLREEVASCG